MRVASSQRIVHTATPISVTAATAAAAAAAVTAAAAASLPAELAVVVTEVNGYARVATASIRAV